MGNGKKLKNHHPVFCPVIPQGLKSQETKIKVMKIRPCQSLRYLLNKYNFILFSPRRFVHGI